MKKTFLILFLLAALNACTEEAWIPSTTNGQNTHYGVRTSGENIDYENQEIMYLKVYDTDGLLVSFGYKTDSVQLPEQILRENDSYIFVPKTDFEPPLSLFDQDLKYIERHALEFWSSEKDGSGDTVKAGSFVKYGQYRVLYAQTKKEYINISFESDYGNAPDTVIVKEKYSYIFQNALPRLNDVDGMKFLEWLYNGEDFSMIYDLDEDMVLKAHYVTVEEYKKAKEPKLSPTGQTVDNSDISAPSTPTSGVYIDKNNCTITKDGKTFKLYGKYQIVSSFPDIKVQYVDAFPDLKIQKVKVFPDKCGKFQEVSAFPDIKIQIVNSFPDLKVKEVSAFPGF